MSGWERKSRVIILIIEGRRHGAVEVEAIGIQSAMDIGTWRETGAETRRTDIMGRSRIS